MDSPPASSRPSISRWLRLSPLGSGSFGHVSLALNLHDRSLFAVKSALSASPSELLALRNELHILQSLHSPFVLPCLGSDFSLRNLFLEYMDGGSLADALKQSGGTFCDEARVRRYTHAILQGLAYLHENGVVHCDIKSQNILIGSSGVKIADFGAARRMGEASPADGNLIRGTPLWMAPEVANGGEPMPSSDIWSLGCTVVEMLQGRPPWGHVSSLAAAIFKVGCSKENPPLPDTISADAKDFLMKCLQREPKARWTAAELLEHNFVCNFEEVGPADCDAGLKQDQPSPRSTLDFLHSDSESDWEDESTMGSVPTICNPAMRACIKLTEGCERRALECIPEGSMWMTVKRVEGWSEKRQAPFMQGAVAGEVLQVRRECEISLEAAEFLRSRVKVNVG